MKQFRLFTIGLYLILLTAIFHLIGHFQPPEISTPEQEQLINTIKDVKFQLDPWFERSVKDLLDAFSLFLTVLLIGIFAIGYIVLKSNPEHRVIKQLSISIFVIMLVMVLLSFKYAFSIPILCFTLIGLLMLTSYFRISA